MEEGLVWILGRWVKPIMVWKIWQRETEAAGDIVSVVKEKSKQEMCQTYDTKTSDILLQGGSTFWSFYNLPEQHQPLGQNVQTEEPTGYIFYLIYNKQSTARNPYGMST